MAISSYKEAPAKQLDESGTRKTMSNRDPSWPPSKSAVMHAGWRLLLWGALAGAGFFANDWMAKTDALRVTAETASRNGDAIRVIAEEVKENRERGQRLQTAIELLTEITRRQEKEIDRIQTKGKDP